MDATTSTPPSGSPGCSGPARCRINCYSEGDITTPFGGYKQSGFGGRDKGLDSLEQYSETKTTWLKVRW